VPPIFISPWLFLPGRCRTVSTENGLPFLEPDALPPLILGYDRTAQQLFVMVCSGSQLPHKGRPVNRNVISKQWIEP
jgi:hypothetical protein